MLKGQGPVPHVHVTEQHGPDRFRHTLQTPCGSQYLDVDPPLYGDGDSSMDGMGSIHGSSVSPNLQGHISFENSPMMDIPHQQWPIPLPIPPMPIWDLVSMGLDEPLPEPDIVEALDRIYFEKIHASIPIIHKGRYYASLNMGPSLRPPVSLRYAMWAMAASVSDDSECSNLQTHFYRRARKCLEESEMKGHGEGFIAVASSQAWQLVASYEFKLMYFPRAWMSTGRAVRLAQMMGLHRVDGGGAEVKLCLPPPRDEIEREERRRTFWTAFCLDRYASIGTGWPMSVEEKDV